MMAPNTMNTLQSNLDEVHAGAPVANKAGNTDAIRIMLREQKRECSELHENPIFKEFRYKQKKCSGAPGQLESAKELPPVIDDLEAEGQTRLTDVIKRAAAERGAVPAGVWANFGQPYACLGELVQMDTSAAALLPKLNRDELSSSQGPRRTSQQKRPGSQHSGQSVAVSAAKQGDKRAGAVATEDKQNNSKDSSGQGQSKAKDDEAAKLLKHKTVAKFSSIDRLEASFPAAAVKQSDERRKAARTGPNKYFNKRAAEVDFKDAAASYGKHTIKSTELPGQALVRQHQAATAAANAAAELAAGNLSPAAIGSAIDTLGDKKSIFITQRAGAGVVGDAAAGAGDSSGGVTARSARGGSPGRGSSPHRLTLAGVSGGGVGSVSSKPDKSARRSMMGVATPGGTARGPRATMTYQDASAHDTSGYNSTAGSQLVDYSAVHSSGEGQGGVTGQTPEFKALTELTKQAPGDDNPVTGWHNEFVKTRHAGYQALQETLWQRSHERAVARSDPAGRAALNKSLMEQLDTTRGKLAPGWIPGTTVESPFANSKQSKAAAAGAAAVETQAAQGTRAIKQSEVELLEQFYDALCGLVEKQRLSDPLSLMVVHKVKALLEGGTFLQPPLLQQVIDHVAEFTKSCGLVRYNRFAFPLLTFIRKCVGVGPAELQNMAAAAGITQVLYEPQQPQQTSGEALKAGKAAGLHVAVDSLGSNSNAAAGSPPASPNRASPGRRSSISPRRNNSMLVGEDSSSNVRRDSKAGGSVTAETGANPGMLRRNSKLDPAAVRDGPVPPIPIDAALAAAAVDMEHAVRSVTQSQRAADGHALSGRLPGVAGQLEAMQHAAQQTGADIAAATAIGVSRLTIHSASGGKPGPQGPAVFDINAAPAVGGGWNETRQTESANSAAADGEPLPDLGQDVTGQPVSRRVKNMEGMQSWKEGWVQPKEAATEENADGDSGQVAHDGDA